MSHCHTLSLLVSWVVTSTIRDNICTKNAPVVCTEFYEMYGLWLFSIMSSVNDNKLRPIKMDQWSSVNIWHSHEVGYLFSVTLRLQLTKTIISRGQHMHHARSYQLNCTKFSLYQNASCHLTLLDMGGGWNSLPLKNHQNA